MNYACLLPYCPLPVDSGARSIFTKHIHFLKSIGTCRILSAFNRPVGFGWTDLCLSRLREQGIEVELTSRKAWGSLPLMYGMLYAILFKALRFERAFGHSNPYHRYAFDQDWFNAKIEGCDLCEIHYTYWARLKTNCPKVVIVHDLWSDIMWEGSKKESKELDSADLLVTISHDDKEKLERRGHKNVHWSPPCIQSILLEDSSRIGIVGSSNRHNVEGLQWFLGREKIIFPDAINCYGGVVGVVGGDTRFTTRKRYVDALDPYRECGIILMLTKGGTGLQIKGVEALASGRAIIARKGAMRGLPQQMKGWVEVDTREEMLDTLNHLYRDESARRRLSRQAKEYYTEFLDKDAILRNLKNQYQQLTG